MARYTSRSWTDDEIKQLKELVKTEHWNVISERLGISIPTIRKKVFELNLHKKKTHRADSALDLAVYRMSETKGLKATAEFYGITVHNVKNSRRRVKARMEQRREEMTVEKYTKLRSIYLVHAANQGRPDLAEDFASWAILRILEGHIISNIQYLYLDFLRSLYGKPNSKRYKQMRALDYAETIVDEPEEGQPGVAVSSNDAKPYDALLSVCVRLNFTPRIRSCFLLYYREGLDLNTIAAYLGVSERTVKYALQEAMQQIKADAEGKEYLAEHNQEKEEFFK